MSQPLFSRRVTIGWLVAAVMTFAGSLYLMARGGGSSPGGDTIGPSTFSRSAIGHAGIAELLRRLGVPVVKSRYGSLQKLDGNGLLVIAEPRYSPATADTLATLLSAKDLLLVLPKWRGTRDASRGDWIGSAQAVAAAEAGAIATLLVADARIERPSAIERWTINALGETPTLAPPLQLVKSTRLKPIVAAGDGILVGAMIDRGRRIWVLSDPDVLENHGLAQAGNAAFAVALINLARSNSGNVVFDETVHGFLARPASPLRLLFDFPFALATLYGAAAVALLLWATTGRFGPPERPPPALAAGKGPLLRNAAKLIEYAGYEAVAVRRYVEASLRQAAQDFHAPRELGGTALVEWLQRIGRSRRADVDCLEVYGRAAALGERRSADPAQLAQIARDIHRWKREIRDGR